MFAVSIDIEIAKQTQELAGKKFTNIAAKLERTKILR